MKSKKQGVKPAKKEKESSKENGGQLESGARSRISPACETTTIKNNMEKKKKGPKGTEPCFPLIYNPFSQKKNARVSV